MQMRWSIGWQSELRWFQSYCHLLFYSCSPCTGTCFSLDFWSIPQAHVLADLSAVVQNLEEFGSTLFLPSEASLASIVMNPGADRLYQRLNRRYLAGRVKSLPVNDAISNMSSDPNSIMLSISTPFTQAMVAKHCHLRSQKFAHTRKRPNWTHCLPKIKQKTNDSSAWIRRFNGKKVLSPMHVKNNSSFWKTWAHVNILNMERFPEMSFTFKRFDSMFFLDRCSFSCLELSLLLFFYFSRVWYDFITFYRTFLRVQWNIYFLYTRKQNTETKWNVFGC